MPRKLILSLTDTDLESAIVAESDKTGESLQAVIIRRLAKSYKLAVEPPKQGWVKGKKRKTPIP